MKPVHFLAVTVRGGRIVVKKPAETLCGLPLLGTTTTHLRDGVTCRRCAVRLKDLKT